VESDWVPGRDAMMRSMLCFLAAMVQVLGAVRLFFLAMSVLLAGDVWLLGLVLREWKWIRGPEDASSLYTADSGTRPGVDYGRVGLTRT